MSCDCLKEKHKLLKSKVDIYAKQGKPVESFNLHFTITGKMIIGCTVRLKNQKKPIESYVVADYCPFCGLRYSHVQK